MAAAYGLDRTWTTKARCREWNADDELTPTPWQFDPGQRVILDDGQELRGPEMIELGLMSCFSCPAQYECAHYAVDGRVNAGTWAMKIVDLTWLGRQPDSAAIIELARAVGAPLQRVVPMLRSIDECEKLAAAKAPELASIT